MSYVAKSLSGAWISDDALTEIQRQYTAAKLREQSALEQTAKLVKLNDERDKLFKVMQEQFDILFDETEELKVEIKKLESAKQELEKEVKRLTKYKKGTHITE